MPPRKRQASRSKDVPVPPPKQSCVASKKKDTSETTSTPTVSTHTTRQVSDGIDYSRLAREILHIQPCESATNQSTGSISLPTPVSTTPTTSNVTATSACSSTLVPNTMVSSHDSTPFSDAVPVPLCFNSLVTTSENDLLTPHTMTVVDTPVSSQGPLQGHSTQLHTLVDNIFAGGQVKNSFTNIEKGENVQIGGTQIINQTTQPENVEEYVDPVVRMASDIAQEHIDRKRNYSRVFVVTKLVSEIMSVLKRSAMAFVIGNPGQGKTDNCTYVLTEFGEGKVDDFRKNLETYVISDPKEFKRVFNKSKRQLFLVEDFLGRTNLIEGTLQAWLMLLEKIKCILKGNQTKILFTSRKHIFVQSRKRIKQISVLCENSIIDLTKIILDRKERSEILESHLREACIEVGATDYIPEEGNRIAGSIISKTTFSSILDHNDVGVLGFPFCCSTFVSHRNFLSRWEEFFRKPTLSLSEEIDIIRDTDRIKYVTLVYILLSGGYLDIVSLDAFRVSNEEKRRLEHIATACGLEHVNLEKIREAADSLVGSFLTKDDIAFRYIHESLKDSVCICLGQNHNDKALQFCSIDVLVEFVSTADSQKDCNKMIVASDEESKHTLIKRLYQALENVEDADKIMCHNVFGDASFVVLFFETMKNSERLQKVINMKGESKNSFLFWACKLDRLQLIDCLLKAGSNPCEKNSYGETVMHLACRCGSLQVLEKITDSFEGSLTDIVNVIDGSKKTPLHVACEYGSVSVVRYLLCCGARSVMHDRDKSGRTPLHLACGNSQRNPENCLSVLDLLFKNGCQSDITSVDGFGKTPLHWAVILKQAKVVELLLNYDYENKAENIKDRGGRSPLHLACKHNASSVVKLLVEHHATYKNHVDVEKRTPLHSACASGGIETVQILLQKFPKWLRHTDKSGKTPLHLACQNGTREIVVELLKHRAILHEVDLKGRTALHIASKYSGPVIVNTLLQHGAKAHINVTDDEGDSPLHLACRPEAVDVVRLLVDQGANINIKNGAGKTALHVAVSRGSAALVTVLLELGADIFDTDNSGKTALDLAKSSENEKIIDLLNQ